MAGSSSAFINERFQQMLDYIKKKGRASVDELAETMYVSKATVRRDLSQMQKMGLVQRTHGGAIPFDSNEEMNFFLRLEENQLEKNETADLAVKHIPEFSSVFIDNSSTCLALAGRMSFSYKTVVTNGLQLALKLAPNEDVKVVLLGGVVQFKTYCTLGGADDLDNYHFDLFLSGAAGIDENGSYESSYETASMKKKAFLSSSKRILLVDRTKFGRAQTYRNQHVQDYDLIITNASNQEVAPLISKGARIVNK